MKPIRDRNLHILIPRIYYTPKIHLYRSVEYDM